MMPFYFSSASYTRFTFSYEFFFLIENIFNRHSISQSASCACYVLAYPEYNFSGGTCRVKVLCYKSEGRWFDSRWCHWNFSLI
jgi:hypothetical protein